jgi:hypothetical protein
MDLRSAEWGRKGATLSDKTARQEYGLTQEEIYAAIDAGTLQWRPAAMHGNPFLRLLRREVEDLTRTPARRGLPAGTAGADRAGADQPRAETAPGPAHRPRGKAGRAPFRTRGARPAQGMTPAAGPAGPAAVLSGRTHDRPVLYPERTVVPAQGTPVCWQFCARIRLWRDPGPFRGQDRRASASGSLSGDRARQRCSIV